MNPEATGNPQRQTDWVSEACQGLEGDTAAIQFVEVQLPCRHKPSSLPSYPVFVADASKDLWTIRQPDTHFPALNSSLSHFPFPALLMEAQIEKKSGSHDSRPSVSHHSDPPLVAQPLKSIESLWRETAQPWMFPHVKDPLCSGKQPGPSLASQRVFSSPRWYFFSSFQSILCFHSSCSCGLQQLTSTCSVEPSWLCAPVSRDHPHTHPNSSTAVSFTPLLSVLYERRRTHNTHQSKKIFPAFILYNGNKSKGGIKTANGTWKSSLWNGSPCPFPHKCMFWRSLCLITRTRLNITGPFLVPNLLMHHIYSPSSSGTRAPGPEYRNWHGYCMITSCLTLNKNVFSFIN